MNLIQQKLILPTKGKTNFSRHYKCGNRENQLDFIAAVPSIGNFTPITSHLVPMKIDVDQNNILYSQMRLKCMECNKQILGD